MSHISPRPDQSTTAEVALLAALNSLSTTPTGQAIAKTGSSSFSNVSTDAGIFLTVGTAKADYITDGVADQVQIQAAVDAASAAGGGVVTIISDCTVNSFVTPKDDVTVQGLPGVVITNDGVTYTVFRHTDISGGLNRFTLKDITLTNSTDNRPAFWYSQGNVNYITFENVRFIATGATGVSGFPVFFDAFAENTHEVYRNCYFSGKSHGWDMLGGGITYSLIEGCTFVDGDGQGTANTGAAYCTYRNNIFYKVGNPISLEGITTSNLIEGNVAVGSGYFKAGLPEVVGEVASFTVMSNNRSYFSGGIEIQGYSNQIIGNSIIRSVNDGMYACLSNSLVVGNLFHQNNYGNSFRTFNATTANKGGIQLVNSAALTRFDRNTIANNSIYSDNASYTDINGSTETDKSGGIAIDTSYTKTKVYNNAIKLAFGVGTAELIDKGTSTIRVLTENVATGSGDVVLATSPTLITPVIATIVNTGTVTLPTATDTLVARATTDTLTNKRVTSRVVSMSDATSFTPTSDTADVNTQTCTQTAGTLTANAPSGTPTDGQSLILRIKCTNVQTWSWDTTFRGSNDIALPTATTGSSKTDYIGFRYNSTDTKWDIVAKSLGY